MFRFLLANPPKVVRPSQLPLFVLSGAITQFTTSKSTHLSVKTQADNAEITAAAHASELCGFCPVTKLPSTQTLEFQSSELSYFAPSSLSFVSNKNGTRSCSPTACSSLLLNAATTLSFTNGVPSGLLHWGKPFGPWHTAETILSAA